MGTAADLPINGTLMIPASELGWRFSRASGPGGQGVNTTDSRVELVFDLAASQVLPEPLRQRALARLLGRLVAGVRWWPLSTAPSGSIVRRRRSAWRSCCARRSRRHRRAGVPPGPARGPRSGAWPPRTAAERSRPSGEARGVRLRIEAGWRQWPEVGIRGWD